MIKFKELTIRNFLSVGNVTQSLALSDTSLCLVIGDNIDLGSNGNRNGTGKTTIINAINYALFGSAISSIRKDNLINKINNKNMYVTLEFEKGDTTYRVERGRKPNVFKFLVNNKQFVDAEEMDESQGESKRTQIEIERILNVTKDIFQQIVTLNTTTPAFLDMKAADQRDFIENLLGICILGQKAEALKAMIKETKATILTEEVTINTITASNEKIQASIDALATKSEEWNNDQSNILRQYADTLESMLKVDTDSEIKKFEIITVYQDNIKAKNTITTELERNLKIVSDSQEWEKTRTSKIAKIESDLLTALKYDVNAEIKKFAEIDAYNQKYQDYNQLQREYANIQQAIEKNEISLSQYQKEKQTLLQNKCFACGQNINDEHHQVLLTENSNQIAITEETLNTNRAKQAEITPRIADNDVSGITPPKSIFASISEAYTHKNTIEKLQAEGETIKIAVNPFLENIDKAYIDELTVELAKYDSLGDPPALSSFESINDIYEYRNKINKIQHDIDSKEKEQNPFNEQIKALTDSGFREISYETINVAKRTLNHQEFIYNLLTKKDSVVRKNIINQNLFLLNNRLKLYLQKLELPYQVTFESDMSVSINNLGNELDFGNLSRGEKTKLIISLSLAFRDVYESLNVPTNLLFVDELLDNGMDYIGVENTVKILKQLISTQNKDIFLVSHREELLSGQVSNILHVIKENGFTSFLAA